MNNNIYITRKGGRNELIGGRKIQKSITFRDVIESNSGDAVEFSVETAEGLKVEAGCWTDDDDVLDSPAQFNVSADWEITCHSPVEFEELEKLSKMIGDRFGGKWAFDAADLCFKQA